jgi:hypothetical protein
MLGDKNSYISVLKQKAGELGGVREIANNIWDGWNPLFEVLADDGIDQAATRDEIVGELTTACRVGAAIFLDFDAVGFLNADRISEILSGLEQRGLIPIPVVTVSSNQNIRLAVRAYIANRGRAAGVRLFFSDPGANTTQNINALIAETGLNVDDSHLFFDLEYIDSNYLPTINAAFPAISALLPQLAQWNTVTLVGTGFPRILDIVGGGNAEIPRTEWEFFNGVRAGFAERVHRLDFGDYAVTNPELIENFDPRTMQVSPKVIYTATNGWIAYKGRSSRGRGFGATRAMCQELMQRSEFLGPTYSAGDQYIVSCAQNTVGQGNSGTWKRVATNHHITFVANQVANIV